MERKRMVTPLTQQQLQEEEMAKLAQATLDSRRKIPKQPSYQTAFCRNCGNNSMSIEATMCPKCGTPTGFRNKLEDKCAPGILLGSFLIPLIGIIAGTVYLIQGRSKAGAEALTYGIRSFVFWIGVMAVIGGL